MSEENVATLSPEMRIVEQAQKARHVLEGLESIHGMSKCKEIVEYAHIEGYRRGLEFAMSVLDL